MKNKYYFYIFVVLTLFLVTLSSVSAEELTTTGDFSISDEVAIDNEDTLDLNSNDIDFISEDANELINDELDDANFENFEQSDSKKGSALSDSNSITVTDKTFSGIQTAVNNANEDYTIFLDGTYVATSTDTQIIVNKKLSFIGQNNAIVDGSNFLRLFLVNASGVTFKDIIFKNGNSTVYNNVDYGGALIGGTAINCSFINNFAGGSLYYGTGGGAMFNGTAINCTFLNNQASYGGAMYNSSAINCTFINNMAEKDTVNGLGGALHGGSAVNCTFINNTANLGGGAVFNSMVENCSFVNNRADKGGATFYGSAINCTFSGNKATYGSAMFNGTAINCTFVSNKALNFGWDDQGNGTVYKSTALNCYFEMNNATNGGAMYDGIAINCTFKSNHACVRDEYYQHLYEGKGGAVYGGNVTNCTFYANTAKLGNAICDANAIDCTFEDYHDGDINGGFTSNCNFITDEFPKDYFEIANYTREANSGDVIVLNGHYFFEAAPYGSGHYNDEDYVRNYTRKNGILINKSLTFIGINNAIIEGFTEARIFRIQSSVNVTFRDITFINANQKKGGAIIVEGTNISISLINCAFINNSASDGDGGAILFSGPNVLANMVNCTFINNSATYHGGAIRGNCTVLDSIFINNSASDGDGGAIYGNCEVVNSNFTNNQAGDKGSAIIYGAAINCSFANNRLTISSSGGVIYEGSAVNCTFVNNAGSALYNSNASNCCFLNNFYSMEGIVYKGTICNCTFDNNTLAVYEGIVINSTFTNNVGVMYRGAAFNCNFINNTLSRSSMSIGGAPLRDCNVTNCTFIGNSVSDSYSGGAMWGGIAINCTFVNNSASDTHSGGAMYDGTAINCTFEGNYASKYNDVAGAIYNGSAINCTFIENRVNAYGGAMKYGVATGCTFKNNNATLGGAIADASAIDCIFIGNHANGYGGAVFIGEDGFEINNCTFINNTAKYGGALAKSWNDRQGSSIPKQNIFQVKVYNSTFINNTALNDSVVFDPEMFYWNVEEGEFITGGAVFLEECGCDISGCLFENNQANGYGGAVTIKQCNDSNINNCQFVDCHSVDDGAAIYWKGGNNLTVSYCTFENCTSINGEGNYLEFAENTNGYNVSDCLFDEAPDGIDYSEEYNPVINVDDLTIYKGEDGILTVNLFDVRGPLSGKTLTFNIAGHDYTNVTDSNGFCTFNIKNYLTTVGNHTVLVSFAGDGLDLPASKEIMVSINRYDAILTVNNLSAYLTEDGFLIANLSSIDGPLAGKTISFTINGNDYTNTTGSDGICTFNIKNYLTTPGNFTVGVSFAGDDYVNPISVNASVNLSKLDTFMTANDITIFNGETANLTIRLCDSNGPLFFKTVVFNFNNKITKRTNDNGEITVNIVNEGKLNTPGEYNITISFAGDDTFNPVSVVSHILIKRQNSLISAENVSFIKGDDGILTVNLFNSTGLANKSINFTIEGDSYYNNTDSNGIAHFNLKDYLSNKGEYFIGISFDGDDYYNPSSTNAKVIVNDYQGILSIEQISNYVGNYYNETSLRFELINSKDFMPISNALINVTFSTGDSATFYTGGDGTYVYKLPMAPGTYTATAVVVDEYVDVNVAKLNNFIISPISGKIVLTQINNNTLNVRLFNPVNSDVYKNIKVSLNFDGIGTFEVITNNQGIATYNMSFEPGTYSVLATVSGPYMEFNAESLDNIVINNDSDSGSGDEKIDSRVSFSGPIVVDYGKVGSTTVAVIGGIINKANITVDGQPNAKINIADKIITVSGLKLGSYTLRVRTTPDENYYSVVGTIGITVRKVSAAIKASNNAVFYKENKKWNIKLIDTRTKKPIAKKTIVLKVYTGKEYKTIKLTTNAKGIASIKASTWAIGKHKVVMSFSQYGHTCKNLVRYVTVKKRVKLTYTVKSEAMVDGSNLFVWAKQGKKPINKVKLRVLVYTGKKYKEYDLVTGNYKSDGKVKKGFIGYGTNMLSVGKHKIVIKPYAYKFTGSKTTYMTIKKSAKKYKQSQVFVSNGKRSMNY